MPQQHIGWRVFPSQVAAERLRAAIDKAAGYPRTEQGTRYVNGVAVGTVDVLTEHLVGIRPESGGTRYAVQITDVADGFHGATVDLPEQSPADVTIDTRTDVVTSLPWE